jgi:hypothetical protein
MSYTGIERVGLIDKVPEGFDPHVTRITIIDTIILNNYTNDAY